MRVFLFICLTIFSFNANAAPKKVVAIGGGITEIIYAIGAQDLLVASDTTSYYPKEAAKLPKVGYKRALSAEGILSLKPDLVILSDEAGPPVVLKQIESAGVKILKLNSARSFTDTKNDIIAIGKVLKKESEARELVKSLNEKQSNLSKKLAKQKEAKKIIFILQHGGGAPMIAGNSTAADSIIKLSGGQNVASFNGYKSLTPEATVSLNPDYILITSQGLKQVGGKDALLKIPGLELTNAAKNDKIIAMDSLLLLGFGPRAIDAAIQLNANYK